MIASLVNIIRDLALRHKLVYTFKYQPSILNNAQNNHKLFQVYMDTVSLHQINITTNIFTSEIELYILGQPNGESGNTIEDVQSYAYTIAVDMLAALDNWSDYKGIISVHDYSILTLTNYTDDNSAGVKLSVVLELPSPLNLCEYESHFDDEPHEEDDDTEIDVPTEDIGEITINPITLPKNRKCS